MTAFRCLFDNPVFGGSPSVGPGVDRRPTLTDRRPAVPVDAPESTEGFVFAVAACARSLVAEAKLTGGGLHYPRAKEPYRAPKRYRSADPRFTWWYLTRAMDFMRDAGLITHAVGVWADRNGDASRWRGRPTSSWPSSDPSSTSGKHAGIPERTEAIVLRDRDDKRELDYPETGDTTAMREQVRIVNKHLARLDLYHRGKKFDIPVVRRIFNGSFDRGGRFYCHGDSFQNMPADQRGEIEMFVDGAAQPVVEIDYASIHITMAYEEAGARPPAGDKYTIAGFSRRLVKVAVNILFNARTRNSGILAVTEELRGNPDLRTDNGAAARDRRTCRTLAERVVQAVEHKHRRISNHFGSDCGARFQRRDSDMAMQIMLRTTERTGRCPLPLHDSFLVAETDADTLARTMREVADEHGLRLALKDPTGRHPTPFHLEVTPPDLRTPQGCLARLTAPFRLARTPVKARACGPRATSLRVPRPRGHDPPARQRNGMRAPTRNHASCEARASRGSGEWL